MKKIITKATAAALALAACIASGVHASAIEIQPPMYNPNGPLAPQPALVRQVNQNTTYRTGFYFNAPARLGGFTRTSYGMVGANIAQGVYTSGNRQLIFRKAIGSTGMRTNLPYAYHTRIAGVNVILRGDNSGYFTAEWSRNGYNFTISSNVPLVYSQMNTIISGAVNA